MKYEKQQNGGGPLLLKVLPCYNDISERKTGAT